MRTGALALLCVLGVALLGGMAVFNRGVKPDRDMQWYVREGAVEVAAPALGEGFDAAAEERDSEFLRPEEGVRTTPEPTPEPTAEPTSEPPAEPEGDGGEVATPDDAQAFEPEAGFETDDDAEPADADADPADGDAVEPEGDAAEDYVGQVTLTITAAGDCTFGGMEGAKSYGRFAEYVGKYGYDYFFDNVRDIFRNDDLTIVNLEGPLTTETKKHSHGYVFKADPSCVQILTGSSVELCNLANNHSQDYGMNGLKQTAQVLDDNGIGFCGYSVAYEKTIKGVRVCALGFTKWDNNKDQIIEMVKEYREKCDLLIVNMHWGWEHRNQYSTEQATVGRAVIDAGADLVIGTHPHVIQGIEKYKDKYIVYSLGNFCFAGNADPEDKRCIIFQQTFSFVVGMNLSRAGCTGGGINIIPANVSSVNYMNDFKPTVMDAEEGARALKALASYSPNFKLKDALWMKDNYLLANGLIKPKGAQDDEGADGEAAVGNEASDGEATDGEAEPEGDEALAGMGIHTDELPPEEDGAADDAPDAVEYVLDDALAVDSTSADDLLDMSDPLDDVDLDEPAPFFSMVHASAL